MQWSYLLACASLIVSSTRAQSVTLSSNETVTSTAADYPTSGVTYVDHSRTVSITASSRYGSVTDLSSALASGNATASSNSTGVSTTSSATQTVLVGSGQSTTSLNGTTTAANATSTSTAALPSNTVPCNGFPELCQRQYSNITHVAAHNSPFVRPGNIASNQALDVETQLNDGIRMLQFQTHLVNETVYLCHTSCELLNAGTLEAYLTIVTRWLRANPYDVITILMGNTDVINPNNYTAPVINSGLIDFVYTAPTVPMPLASWPTLAEMIFNRTRAVVMLDYEANQTAIPWLLDEFGLLWETPFSPTDRDFPCTVQRPPDQPREISEDRMYIMNQNLNVDIAVAGISIDVPATTILNETNGVEGYGSAGASVANCTELWNRPPTFLLVDYYNQGSFNGSIFQVAADANNVTYNRDSCCGTEKRAGSAATYTGVDGKVVTLVAGFVLAALLF